MKKRYPIQYSNKLWQLFVSGYYQLDQGQNHLLTFGISKLNDEEITAWCVFYHAVTASAITTCSVLVTNVLVTPALNANPKSSYTRWLQNCLQVIVC